MPLTEEVAEKCSQMTDYADLEALPATVEEIEEVCKNHDLTLVGFVGFEEGPRWPGALAGAALMVLPLVRRTP